MRKQKALPKISVKISTPNYANLQKIRKIYGMPIRFMLDRAVEEYCRKKPEGQCDYVGHVGIMYCRHCGKEASSNKEFKPDTPKPERQEHIVDVNKKVGK